MEVLVGPATFDVPSPVSGRLAEIHGLEDDRVEPGSVLGLVATAEDDAVEAVRSPSQSAASAGRNRRSVAPRHDHVS